MKRFFSVLLVITMMACLMAGCGGKETSQPTAPVVTAAPVPETTAPVVETTVPVPETVAPVVYTDFFYFWDYEGGEYVASNVATYQEVTGAVCEFSSLDFSFLEEDYTYVVEGYDPDYGVFLYEYDAAKLNAYRDYLTSIGYTFVMEEKYQQGTSYYYEDKATGFTFDLFVVAGNQILAIEPYLNGEMQ